MTKLVVAAMAVLFVAHGHAASQSHMSLVIAVDLSASVAVRGPDEKS